MIFYQPPLNTENNNPREITIEMLIISRVPWKTRFSFCSGDKYISRFNWVLHVTAVLTRTLVTSTWTNRTNANVMKFINFCFLTGKNESVCLSKNRVINYDFVLFKVNFSAMRTPATGSFYRKLAVKRVSDTWCSQSTYTVYQKCLFEYPGN